MRILRGLVENQDEIGQPTRSKAQIERDVQTRYRIKREAVQIGYGLRHTPKNG